MQKSIAANNSTIHKPDQIFDSILFDTNKKSKTVIKPDPLKMARDIDRYADEQNQFRYGQVVPSSKMKTITMLSHVMRRNVKILEDGITPFNVNNKLIYQLVKTNYDLLEMLRKKDRTDNHKIDVTAKIDAYNLDIEKLQNQRHLYNEQKKFLSRLHDYLEKYWKKYTPNLSEFPTIYQHFYQLSELVKTNLSKIRHLHTFNVRNNSLTNL